MKLRDILTDAKKACGAAVIGAGAALAAGLIDDATAAEITGVAGVVTTVVVYLLRNEKQAD